LIKIKTNKENNMAHECPNCGLTCFCGGDIDDILFIDPIYNCGHCLENDHENDFEDEWEDCETNQGDE